MPPNPQSEEIYEVLQRITQEYQLAIVFGSYARGEAYSNSDVDVLLIDSQFDGWTVHTDKQTILSWPNSLPQLHLVCCSPTEFEERYAENEEMVQQIVEEGFSVHNDFAFVDYIKQL